MQPQVAAAADGHGVDEPRAGDAQQGLGVAVAARLERVERLDACHGQQVRIVHAQVARELRQVVGRVFPVILAERAAEAVDVFSPDGQPGRQRVAAEALEILRAGAQGVIQVEAAKAAARALAALAVAADHDRRQVELLTQARGGDADHALMPRVAREHERRARRIAARDGRGFLPDLLLKLLPLAVELAEPGGVAVGVGAVIGQQQQRGDGRFSEAAGRVDARREREADGRGRDRPSLRAALVQQRADAGAGAGVDLRQSLRHEVAVFAREGHDVGHRADGDEVAVVAQHLFVAALERAQQLERHAHARKPAVGILRAGALRVDDGHGVRDRLPAALVVVGDDHVDAALQGVVRLVDGGDAAVDGDDERDVVGALKARDRVHVQAVALLDAVGDVRVHGHAAAAQIVREHARGRDAVDVIVAEHGHVFPALDGGADARDGLVHVLQEHGVEHALVAAAEKGTRLPGVVIAAQCQQHRQQRGIARAQQRLRRLRRGIWNFPVAVFHMRCVPQIQNDRLQ